jgi:hypothetical protein
MDYADRRRIALDEIIERHLGWVFDEYTDVPENRREGLLEEHTRLMRLEIFNLSWTGFAETNELQIQGCEIPMNC